MNPRPTRETIESLRITLHKLEQTADREHDEQSMADLKRIVLNRIAELEMSVSLESVEAEIAETPAPADLVPPASIAESDPRNEVIDTTQSDKLD